MFADREDLRREIDEATERLLETARALPDEAVRAPSLLPGWTRAHVLTHLARGADAMLNLLEGARTGIVVPAYPSPAARDGAIAAGAARSAAALLADVTFSAAQLRRVVVGMPSAAWGRPVRALSGAPFPAAGLLERRLAEVVLHHTDLDAGYRPEHWPRLFAQADLPEPMRTQRADRAERAGRRVSSPEQRTPRPAGGPADQEAGSAPSRPSRIRSSPNRNSAP